MATVVSQPITWKQTWFTISGIDGFILPGMIDDPGCTAGSRISSMPGARTHDHQAQVARDLAQVDGEHAELRAEAGDVAHALHELNAIRPVAQIEPA